MPRVYDKSPHEYEPGDYGLYRPYPEEPDSGLWFCRCPCVENLSGNLTNHVIEVHDDGTITVSPSILVRKRQGYPDGSLKDLTWHGFLQNGVWSTLGDSNTTPA